MARTALLVCAICATAGCQFYLDAVPAERVPPVLRRPLQQNLEKIDLRNLQVPRGEPYRLAPGDTLAVNADNLYVDKRELPVPTTLPGKTNGRIIPSTGYPVVVRGDGRLTLPGIPALPVAGLTVEEAERLVQERFRGILGPADRPAPIRLTLMLPRTRSVLVVREDAVAPMPIGEESAAAAEGVRYRGLVFDLPLEPAQSDIMTALAATGGLPGLDAKNEVVILRGRFSDDEGKNLLRERLLEGGDLLQAASAGDAAIERIPLRTPGGVLPSRVDARLRAGDVVLIETRKGDVFFVGGVFKSGEFPLPRDKPLDVLQAVAIAGGTQSGLDYGAGGRGGIASLGDATSLVPPTWLILVREIDGKAVRIKIDLQRATWDSSQRIIVQAGDYLHLAYSPSELAANVSLKSFGTRIGARLIKHLSPTGPTTL
ncbi:MAG: polysaccharide biosynthesis/export family protein [Pirellulales bacterium]